MSQYGNDELTFIFTRDKKLLKQYVELRQYLYKHDPFFKGFRFFDYLEEEDYNKPQIQTLLILHENRCVGGGCLTVSTPQARILLSLEEDLGSSAEKGSFLQKTFPELQLEQEKYCEFGRIAVHPDYRRGDCTKTMFCHVVREARAQSVRYMFGMGDALRLRLYKKICMNEFGMKSTTYSNIKLPEKSDYEGVRMYIQMVDVATASL